MGQDLFAQAELGPGDLISGMSTFLKAVGTSFHGGKVSKNEFGRNYLDVPNGIDRSGNVMDVRVLKTADHLHDCIDFANMAEKLIAEAFSLACALHQAGDIDEFDSSRDDLLGFREHRELFQTLIRHADDAQVWFDGAERKICSMSLPGARDGVEESGLANIGQSDDSGFEHQAGKATESQTRGKCEESGVAFVRCVIFA